MDWEPILKERYQDRIEDDELLDEAIATLEQFFELSDKDKLLHHHRDWAIPYLALRHVKRKATEK